METDNRSPSVSSGNFGERQKVKLTQGQDLGQPKALPGLRDIGATISLM